MERQIDNYWTKKRIELCKWFEKNAPSLGELYKVLYAWFSIVTSLAR